MGINEYVKYIQENFEKRYADEIAKGTYDERDLSRLKEDTIFARSYIRGKDRLDEGVDLVHSSFKFRKEIGVNDLNEYSFSEELWNIGGVYFRKRDIDGKRIYWLHVKKHVKNASAERLIKEKEALIYGLERAFNEAPLEQIVVLLDMTSCGLANLDMDFVKYIITIFKFYYPTFLGYMLIYDMPWIFNAAWKVIKAWLSAEAAAKIKFVTKSDIQTYIKGQDLPDYMGGTDNFVYEYKRGMAQGRVYPEEEDEHKKQEKKVHFQEAREPSLGSELDAQDRSEDDNNANGSARNSISSSSGGGSSPSNPPASVLRNRSNSGSSHHHHHSNRNNNSNEKRPTKMPGFPEPGALIISPADELTFHTETGGDAFDIITLSNTLMYPVAYKVKTTSPEKFRVRPSSGIINPRKTEEVYVYLVQDHQTDVAKDKFLIMAMEVKPGSGSDPNQLFKEASKDKIMQHKLMCAEEGSNKKSAQESSVSSQQPMAPLLAKGPKVPGKPVTHARTDQGEVATRPAYHAKPEQSELRYPAPSAPVFTPLHVARPARVRSIGDDEIDKQVEQLEQQTHHMQRQLNLLLVIQLLTAFTLVLVMLAYSCVGEELFTKFLALPFDFCTDPYYGGRKC